MTWGETTYPCWDKIHTLLINGGPGGKTYSRSLKRDPESRLETELIMIRMLYVCATHHNTANEYVVYKKRLQSWTALHYL